MKFREKSEGGKNFIKLKSGDSIQGVFQGNPYEFRQHWVDNSGQPCTENGCTFCANKVKSNFRFRLNLIISENGDLVPKIFEQGWTVYEQLRELHKEYGLDKTLVKISRQGEGKDTTYSILPAKTQPTPAQFKKISEVQLLPLEHEAQESAPVHGSSYENDANEDAPF